MFESKYFQQIEQKMFQNSRRNINLPKIKYLHPFYNILCIPISVKLKQWNSSFFLKFIIRSSPSEVIRLNFCRFTCIYCPCWVEKLFFQLYLLNLRFFSSFMWLWKGRNENYHSLNCCLKNIFLKFWVIHIISYSTNIVPISGHSDVSILTPVIAPWVFDHVIFISIACYTITSYQNSMS